MKPLARPSAHTSDQRELDRAFMREAVVLAGRIPGRTWPNPPVGAVVVKDGRVLGRGAHHGPGRSHAEPVALTEAGSDAQGATLYVTLEPCNHEGRTGPCAPAVWESGIRRVVVGVRDPNPTVSGGGCRFLRDHGIEVQVGVEAEAALDLIWPFVVTENFRRPYVELKTAQSLDGFYAPPVRNGSSPAPVYLTGAESLSAVHRRRRWLDLVLVGEGTARADRPRLDGRLALAADQVPAADPAAGYVDTDLSWDGGLDREEFLVFAGNSARGGDRIAQVEQAGGQVIFCREEDGKVAVDSLLEEAARQGYATVMVEGGPLLAAAFLKAGKVDRWIRYTASVVLNGGVRWPEGTCQAGEDLERYHLIRTGNSGADQVAVYDRRSFAEILAQVTV